MESVRILAKSRKGIWKTQTIWFPGLKRIHHVEHLCWNGRGSKWKGSFGFLHSSFCISLCPRWPSKNSRQRFLLVSSSARCSHSRSLTSLLRTNKLFWGDKLLTKIKYYMHALLKVEPPLPHILAFCVFGPCVPCFPSPCFQTLPPPIRSARGKNEKIDTSRENKKDFYQRCKKVWFHWEQKNQVARIVQHFVFPFCVPILCSRLVFPFCVSILCFHGTILKKQLWKKILLPRCGRRIPIMGEFSAVKHHFWWSFQTE